MDINNGGFPAGGARFACPFRKHDPQRYSLHEGREICALRSWNSVSRVKEHLYRCHLAPPYCLRCWAQFKTDEELSAHYASPVSRCSEKLSQRPEGITKELEKALRKRNKDPQWSEENRWKDIYCLLFSSKDAPSPYFEPVHEDASMPSHSEWEVLNNYAKYSRREIPPLFCHMLGEQLGIEGDMMLRLSSILEVCLERILSNYRNQFAPTPSTSTFNPSTAMTPPIEGMALPGSALSLPSSNSEQPQNSMLLALLAASAEDLAQIE